jgi:ribosome assembly protein YihI (activator of Der GTPase)
MKNLLCLSVLAIFLFGACSGSGEQDTNTSTSKTENKAVAECDATVAASAAKCLCDLYNKLDNSSDLSDEDYKALNDKIDEFNKLIDKALDAENYTNDELVSEGEKIDCKLF